jgi:hypothetical protein
MGLETRFVSSPRHVFFYNEPPPPSTTTETAAGAAGAAALGMFFIFYTNDYLQINYEDSTDDANAGEKKSNDGLYHVRRLDFFYYSTVNGRCTTT